MIPKLEPADAEGAKAPVTHELPEDEDPELFPDDELVVPIVLPVIAPSISFTLTVRLL